MKHKRNHRLIVPGLMPWFVLAGWLMACHAGNETGRPRLRLAVSEEARPYTGGLAESLADFQKRIGVAVDVEVVSASRVLARLEEPAPPDLVLMCDPALTRALIERKLLGPERWLLERRRDRVALVARAGDPLAIARLADLARADAATTIGLTDHVNSNVGYVTDLALRRMGLYEKLQRRLKFYGSQARLAEGLRRGAARVGFLRESSLGKFGPDLKTLLVFDPVEDQAQDVPHPGLSAVIPSERGGPKPPYVAFGVNRRSAQPVRAHQCWGALEMFFRAPAMYLIDASDAGNMFGLENLAN